MSYGRTTSVVEWMPVSVYPVAPCPERSDHSISAADLEPPPNDPDFVLLAARTLDEDVRIRRTSYQRVAGIPVLFEEWVWDGILARSAIFLRRDVGSWSDQQLIAFLRNQAGIDVGDQVAISRKAGNHIFVNYQFQPQVL